MDTMLNVALLLVIVFIVYLTLGGSNPLSGQQNIIQQLNDYEDYEDYETCGSAKSPLCKANNYCFKGSYARSTVDPDQFLQYRDLDRPLEPQSCFKDTNPFLKNYPCERYKFQCVTDTHGVNRCEWVKN